MNNQNKDIYANYQDDNQAEVNKTAKEKIEKKEKDKVYYANVNPQNKSNKILKTAMIISLVLALVGVGGFTLVYTGVIKFKQITPESILLNASNIGIRKGKSYQYDYQVYPEGSTAKNVYYESSDPSVAEVNETTGYITPKKEGTTTISIKSTVDDTVVEKSNLSVTNEKVAIEDIKLSSERIVFDLSNKSTSQLLKVLTEPYNATMQDLSFSTSDESVAVVDQSGKVYPVGFGMATIAVRAKDGNASATCEVIVTDSENKQVYFELPDKGKLVFPYAIQLDTNYLKLKYGTSRKVGFILLPPDVTEDVVTWISSDPNVATVKEGVIEGVAVGTTTVTARTVNDLVAKLTVEVTDEEVTSSYVSFNDDLDEMEIGESKRLNVSYDPNATVANFEWSSSNPEVISVDEQGVATALSKGSAVITVKPASSSSSSVTPMSAKPMASSTGDSIVIVSDGEELPSFLVVKESEFELGTGSSRTIEVEGDTGNTNYTFKSTNTQVATVSPKGVVYGVSVGEAVITIGAVNGVSASVKVKVVDVPASKVTISSLSGYTVKKGSEKELIATVYPENATNRKIVWTSSNPNVLTVNEVGVVKGVAIGESTVTASVGTQSTSVVIKVTADDVNDETTTPSKVLSSVEIESLKKVPILFERVNDTQIKITLDLDKYGYSDYVTLSKTKFSIANKASTIKNLTIKNINKMPTSKTLTFKSGSYGSFDVKVSVYLPGNKKTIELEKATYTINEDMTVETSIPVGMTTAVANYFANSAVKKVTEWSNSNTGVLDLSNGNIEAKAAGLSIVTGKAEGYTFILKVTVTDEVKEVTDPNDYTFIYDKCYSAYELCQGGTLQKPSFQKNTNKCSTDAPYYIDKQKTKYSFKCKVGDVVTTYNGESTYAIIDKELKFDHSANTAIKKGEEITVKISNWDKLNLASATVVNSLDNTTTNIKKASFKVAVPSGTTAKNFKITVEAKSGDKSPKVYKGTLVLSVSEEALLTDIKCETNNELTLEKGKTKDLSCVLIDKSNNTEIPMTSNDNPEYSSNKTSVATVDANGKITALKKGTATITVKSHGLKRKVTVNVTKGAPVYNYLSLKLNKTTTGDKIMAGETGVTLSYVIKTSKSDKNKITSGLTVVYTSNNSNVVEMNDNQIIAKAAGTATITGTYINANGEEVKATIDVVVVSKGSLDPKIESLNCGPRVRLVLNSESVQLDCQAYDSANEKTITAADGQFTYTIKDKSIVSIDQATGVVTPKKKGTTEITVKIKGYSKSATVKAEVLTDKITYQSAKITNLDNVELKKGETLDITYVLTTSDNVTNSVDKNVKFKSSDTDIASVDGNKITAKKKGNVTITLTYTNPDSNEKLTDKKTISVYVDKTCYRYKKVTIDGYDTCRDGYGYYGKDEKNCYKIVTSATSKETCEYKGGQKLSQRKWTNSTCLDLNDRYANKKSPHEAAEYTYTSDKKKTQGNTFDPAKDELICKNSCSQDTCQK